MDRVSAHRRALSLSLAGMLLLASCQNATPPSHESEDTTLNINQTAAEIPTETVETAADTAEPAETETRLPETEAETLPVESAPDENITYHGYTEAELALLAETARQMSGLRVTYFADTAATQAISGGVIPTAEITFRAGDGVQSAVLEGFITFAEDGAVALEVPGATNGDCVSLIEGEHHVRAGRKLRAKVKAGAQYGIKLKIDRVDPNADQTMTLLCNDSSEGFTLTVGRVLLEHENVKISPVLDIPLRDTFVCVGPDGYYYMTGTTGPDFWDNNYVIHIYRSADLTEWEDLGEVWDFREDATWAKDLSKEDRVPVWAPELCYVNGNWYMTYTMGFWDAMSCGILVSTTGRPEGPYTDTSDSRLVDNLDGSLFVEDDGTVYFIYKDGLIAPLNEDLSGFAGGFQQLLAADGLPVGFEGCSIFKHNGKYYLTAATYNQSYDENGNLVTTYDSMIAVSDTLMGPYSETRLLLRNGGHNNLFADKDGNVWNTLFAPTGTLGFSCQPAIVRLTEDERGILTVAPQDSE